jgi:hypothetical protein
VGTAELGHRIVAIAQEDVLVEPAGALALGAVVRAGGSPFHVLCELVEEQPPQRPRVAGVAGEQGALDGLRQVDEAEYGQVEVGEMRLERGSLGGGELFDRVLHGPASLAPGAAMPRLAPPHPR